MSFESTTLGVLTAHAGLTALIAAADMHLGLSPQNAAVPYLNFFVVSTVPGTTTDNGQSGKARLDNYRIQVDVYCATAAESIAAAEQVRLALEANTGTQYFFEGMNDDFSDAPNSYGRQIDFSCWYQSNS